MFGIQCVWGGEGEGYLIFAMSYPAFRGVNLVISHT